MWVITLQLVYVLPKELPLLEKEGSQVGDLLNTSFWNCFDKPGCILIEFNKCWPTIIMPLKIIANASQQLLEIEFDSFHIKGHFEDFKWLL
jgi:hypothetical protein